MDVIKRECLGGGGGRRTAIATGRDSHMLTSWWGSVLVQMGVDAVLRDQTT